MGCQGCKKMVEVRMMSARFDEKTAVHCASKERFFTYPGDLKK